MTKKCNSTCEVVNAVSISHLLEKQNLKLLDITRLNDYDFRVTFGNDDKTLMSINTLCVHNIDWKSL